MVFFPVLKSCKPKGFGTKPNCFNFDFCPNIGSEYRRNRLATVTTVIIELKLTLILVLSLGWEALSSLSLI